MTMHHLSHLAAYRAGLSQRDSAVLEYMVDMSRRTDDAVVASSRYELASALGMSPDVVQRALIALRDKGFLVRRQDVRAPGWVALTALLPRAFALFGLPVPIGSADLPADLAVLLAGQPHNVVSAVADAYAARDLPAPSVQSSYCGSSAAWEAIEDLLRGRMPLDDPGDCLDEDARLVVPLADRTEVEFDLRPLRALAGATLDAGLLRRVLATLGERRGVTDTEAMTALLAEAAFSRARGFVCGHEKTHAERVLAKVMARACWSRPRSITPAWYAAAARARRHLSTAPAMTVH